MISKVKLLATMLAVVVATSWVLLSLRYELSVMPGRLVSRQHTDTKQFDQSDSRYSDIIELKNSYRPGQDLAQTKGQRRVLSRSSTSTSLRPQVIDHLEANSGAQFMDQPWHHHEREAMGGYVSVMEDRVRKNNVYMYSAFWDDRGIVGDPGPVIRVPALVTIKRGTMGTHDPLECLFTCPGSEEVYMEPAIHNGTLEPTVTLHSYIHIHVYRYMFTCSMPPCSGRPNRVTLISSTGAERLGQVTLTKLNSVPVEYPVRPPHPPHDFYICVSLSYWHIDPYRLVEWLEMSRLLGVSRVFIYNDNLSLATSLILRHYEDIGYVEVRNLRYFFDYSRDDINVRSALGVNDCVYRNLYKAKYITVLDTDEFIVPQKSWELGDLMQDILEYTRGTHYANYRFRHTEFILDPDLDGDADLNKSAQTMLLRYRAHMPPLQSKVHQKSVIEPLGCVAMSQHRCKITAPGYIERPWLWVPTHLGLDHHYRDHLCTKTTSLEQCHRVYNSQVFSRNDRILHYEGRLLDNMNTQLHLLGYPPVAHNGSDQN